MRTYRKNSRIPWMAVMSAFLFLAMLITFVYGVQNLASSSEEEQRSSLAKAVRRSVVQCYALEGVYPRDLTYLEKNYGLVIDRSRYIVHYQASSANLFPDIVIFDAFPGGE